MSETMEGFVRPSWLESLRLKVSAKLVRRLLVHMPRDPALLARMGLIQLNLGEFAQAHAHLERSRNLQPANPFVHYNLGRALEGLGQAREALKSYERAISIDRDFAAALERRRQLAERIRSPGGGSVSSISPATPAKSLRSGARDVSLVYQKARALHQKGRHKDAAALYQRILKMDPAHAQTLHMLGVLALQAKQYRRAADLIGKAIAGSPDEADFHSNLGLALQELKELEPALASYDRALALRPVFPEAWCNRGDVLAALRRFDAAVQSYDQALAIEPDVADTHLNRGFALQELGQTDAAIASYERAIALRPDLVEARFSLGALLKSIGRPDAALVQLDKAFQLKPDRDFLLGDLLGTRMVLASWEGTEVLMNRLSKRIRNRERAANPFSVLAMVDTPALQKNAAEIWAGAKHPQNDILGPIPARAKGEAGGRLRIGYYSADFHRHATSYLMAGLFERHDKSRFELIAFCFDRNEADDMRRRVAAAFDRFIDVRAKSDLDVARLSREMNLDIAIDLKGYTGDSRNSIFAHRAAPIQVSYLGYPGTLGAGYIDYLIADHTLIPPQQQAHYSEKIVYLPDTYQVNDDKRAISDRAFTRAEMGLPEAGFVFCCFCNTFKISPVVFDVWMRLLNAVEGSVLWLIEDNPTATANLRKEAERRGVDPTRLVFASRIELPEHLARQRLADLFIDTLPYGAHTTASDALWAGLPVLTCAGESFASRVAASLLNAIGLPELVTGSLAQYEALALALAADPQRLQGIRQKLADHRLTTPLFDTARFTRHIEAAYLQMQARHLAGLPPEHISIQA